MVSLKLFPAAIFDVGRRPSVVMVCSKLMQSSCHDATKTLTDSYRRLGDRKEVSEFRPRTFPRLAGGEELAGSTDVSS
jgi:hypothetical protein